jgi:hypothetical protein
MTKKKKLITLSDYTTDASRLASVVRLAISIVTGASTPAYAASVVTELKVDTHDFKNMFRFPSISLFIWLSYHKDVSP